jgi:hypothetical protein
MSDGSNRALPGPSVSILRVIAACAAKFSLSLRSIDAKATDAGVLGQGFQNVAVRAGPGSRTMRIHQHEEAPRENGSTTWAEECRELPHADHQTD